MIISIQVCVCMFGYLFLLFLFRLKMSLSDFFFGFVYDFTIRFILKQLRERGFSIIEQIKEKISTTTKKVPFEYIFVRERSQKMKCRTYNSYCLIHTHTDTHMYLDRIVEQNVRWILFKWSNMRQRETYRDHCLIYRNNASYNWTNFSFFFVFVIKCINKCILPISMLLCCLTKLCHVHRIQLNYPL